MKMSLFSFFLLLTFHSTFGQNIPVNKIPSYKVEGGGVDHTVVVEMPFGKADVLKITGDTAELKTAGACIMEVVCTDYPSTASLYELNKRRITAVFHRFPFLQPQQVLNIQILRQTDGSERQWAEGMFHGVVIHFRPPQTKETMEQDLLKLDQLLEVEPVLGPKDSSDLAQKTKAKNSTPDAPKPAPRGGTIRALSGYVTAGKVPNWRSDKFHDSTCYVNMTPKEALEMGYISKKDYEGNRRVRGWKVQEYLTILVCSDHDTASEKVGEETAELSLDSAALSEHALKPNHPLPDSTILKVLSRNRWRNMAITGDVTGSMYPYAAQLLLWLKLQSLDSLTTYYTFFNDGDDTPDHRKRLGKTGGIYSKPCNSFSEVLELVKTTMYHGGGGDAPENNVEALIQTEKQYPDVAFHVLIADNWAPLKDIKLASQLTKPVRIVLCGALHYINTDYLDLARRTKGSVHLIEEDITNLAALHEGEVIQIGHRYFKLMDGNFKEVGDGKEKNL